jgi:hypothetical protein
MMSCITINKLRMSLGWSAKMIGIHKDTRLIIFGMYALNVIFPRKKIVIAMLYKKHIVLV